MAGLCLLILPGCGGPRDDLAKQEEQLQQMIEEAQEDPSNMTPAEREMRRGRLEMDFGVEPKKKK